MRVLAAGDTQLYERLRGALAVFGGELTTVDSYASAVAALADGSFALIVASHPLDEGDGIALLAHAKTVQPEIWTILHSETFGSVGEAREFAAASEAVDDAVKFNLDELLWLTAGRLKFDLTSQPE